MFRIVVALSLLLSHPSLAILDRDQDGMSDIWEKKFGAGGLLPGGDADQDGETNLQEGLAGTNPFNPASRISIRFVGFSGDLAVNWSSSPGDRFSVEEGNFSNEPKWLPMGEPQTARRNQSVFPLNSNPFQKGIYRVKKLDKLDQASLLYSGTGINHGPEFAREVFYGLAHESAFDPDSLKIEPGFTTLVWQSEEGKSYTILKHVSEESSAREIFAADVMGTGGIVTFSFPGEVEFYHSEFQMVVSDLDSDGDELSDWEELTVGTDPRNPRSNPDMDGDLAQVLEELSGTAEVRVESTVAVANLSRGSSGVFKISRSNGIQEIWVNFVISGSAQAGVDFTVPSGTLEFGGVLFGTAKIPFGESAIEIEIEPLADSDISLSASVALTVEEHPDYLLPTEEFQSASVNIVKEVPLNVRDFGAVGDGIVDDTLAVQSALDALGASKEHNTLHFPAGTYRLNTETRDHFTVTSEWHLLTFGTSDLAGRDLFFTGEPGSRLYSTVSPLRAHMLVVLGTFRSLTSFGMTWQKDNELLSSAPPGKEPNGADGFSLVALDNRVVEHVKFQDCKFINCHGALMITGNGIDRRGHLQELGFYGCQLLNPFGSNTKDGGIGWGGGQQTYLSQWVGRAIYEGNFFEGGGEDMSDGPYTEGGRLKDAAMIGGPVVLEFRNNVVRRMGIEAVFHNGRANFLTQTISAVTIPEPDGVEVAVVDVDRNNTPSTFVPGSQIIIRIPTTNTEAGIDNIFEVVEYDPETKRVSFINNGNPANSPAGFLIPRRADVYLSEPFARPLSLVTGNILEGDLPLGADSQSYSVGVTMNSRALVANNRISGWKVGVMSYIDKQEYHRATGLIVRDNLITLRDTTGLSSDAYHIGVRSWAPSQLIENNTIIVPNSRRTLGIGVYGRGANIRNNYLYVEKSEEHPYDSYYRSVGIAHGNQSSLTTISNNFTNGFNVGVGPSTPSQSIPHIVRDHLSLDEELPIDPRGLVEEFE